MDVRVVVGAIQNIDADAIIVNLFEGVQQPSGATGALDQALGGAISEIIAAGDFSGKLGQTAVLYPRGAVSARRVIIVGLGPRQDFELDVVRRVSATVAQRARELGVRHAATILHGAGVGGLNPESAAQAITEGTLLGLYEYEGIHTGSAGEPEPDLFESCDVVVFDEGDLSAVMQGVTIGQAIADSVMLARDLVNMPPNFCTPTHMAETAVKAAESLGMRVQVLERGQMKALGMGALLSVAQGSDTPPRFIIMEHNAARAEELESIVLVGKGVTFDTGGYSLKTKTGMATMKVDMAGGAAVIGAMRAIAALNVPLHVVGLVPASDNMINGSAYRPQEVVTASNGVTIEIVSTDAEGRMLLADALVFARRFEPAAVVDIATLTGACVTALGGAAAGLFCTDDGLQAALLAAADETDEKLWPLPLFPEYEKTLESDVADFKHSGGAGSGVGSSAMFLKQFTDYPAWAHIDMAGLASDAKGNPYAANGATGFGVRLLTEFAVSWSARKA